MVGQGLIGSRFQVVSKSPVNSTWDLALNVNG